MKLLSTINLTDNQKRVIAKVVNAPTPNVAAQEISKDTNLVAARNMLMKLGILTFSQGSAEVSDRGMALAQAQNIVDDGGNLTDLGQKLAATQSNGQPDKSEQPAAGAPGGDMGAMGADPAMGDPSMQDPSMQDPSMGPPPGDDLKMGESYSVLKQLLS